MGILCHDGEKTADVDYCVQCGHKGKTKIKILDSKNIQHGRALRCRGCGNVELYLDSDKDIELLLAGRFFSGSKI